jgi:FAD synthase
MNKKSRKQNTTGKEATKELSRVQLEFVDHLLSFPKISEDLVKEHLKVKHLAGFLQNNNKVLANQGMYLLRVQYKKIIDSFMGINNNNTLCIILYIAIYII